MGLGKKLLVKGNKAVLAAGLATAPLLVAGCNCGPDISKVVEGASGAVNDVMESGEEVVDLASETFDKASCNYAEDGGNLDEKSTKKRLAEAAKLLNTVTDKMTLMGENSEYACKRHISPGSFEIDGELVGDTDNVVSVTSQKKYRDRDAEVGLPAGAAGQGAPDWNRGLYFEVDEDATTGNELSAISLKLDDNHSVAVGIKDNFKKVGPGKLKLVVKEVKVTFGKGGERNTTVTTYMFDLRTNGGQITEVTQAYVYDGADNNVCSPGSGFVVEKDSPIQASVVNMLNAIPDFADKISDKCRLADR